MYNVCTKQTSSVWMVRWSDAQADMLTVCSKLGQLYLPDWCRT